MKKLSVTLLILGVFASGCDPYTDIYVDLHAEGRIHLPDGQPAVGAQGDLCAMVTSPKNSTEIFCESIFTDAKGDFSIRLYDRIVDYLRATTPFEVHQITVAHRVGEEISALRKYDPSELASLTKVVVNFTNKRGYAWGRGEEVKKFIDLGRASTNTRENDQILESYAGERLAQLNPNEITSIAKSLYNSAGRNRMVWTYACLASSKGKVDERTLGMLASTASSTDVRARIADLASTPCGK